METEPALPSADEGSPSLDLAAERAEPSAGRQRALTPTLSKPLDKLRRTGSDTQSVTFLSERMVKGCAQGATDHCISCVESNNWNDGAKFELPRKMPTADHPVRIVFAIEGIGGAARAESFRCSHAWTSGANAYIRFKPAAGALSPETLKARCQLQ